MASFLSKAILLPVAASIHRRGYAAASHGSVAAGFGMGGSRSTMVRKLEEKVGMKEESSSAWAPDPRTGYYRPANRADEIDPVELRQMLLNQKVRQQ
ncbi:PREDICTED: late embryogenesis abundant protein Lea5 [Fragaria vesca subsp. vesca]|uniref:late embryogenesis abundant protein Lea5 n=1 Tax=Fragaria vesca subsp. vesca TaxID=101020 RepID=UPI0002C2DEA6|nr:PREDICTED: late embryogenesis abundant protein Lea5 [Fragaria vesca subsp. vesca]